VDLDLAGRVVVASGSSRGIGLGIAEACLAEGAKVALAARGAEQLESERRRLAMRYGGDRVWAMPADMAQTADVESILVGAEENLGEVYGVVSNVGYTEIPQGIDVDDEQWQAGLLGNVNPAIRLARAALRLMMPRRQGAVVFISSIAGHNAPNPFPAPGLPYQPHLPYSTAKAAINQLAKELSRVSGRANVRVNAVAPGNIIFPGGGWETTLASPVGPNFERWIEENVSLQRLGTAREIGDLVAFLLSPRASFVNGEVVVADGGQSW
jgi:3-oxoacyl-[acyl-carrier protein] reductase